MNRARIVVLGIALVAGGIAAYLASGSDDKPAQETAAAQVPTVDVLVAKADIGLGQIVQGGDLQWQTWPTASASSSFIKRSDRPNAETQIAGSLARAPFIAGEPIRDQKLVKGEGSGFMAAILPSGMRAVSTEISPETGAGGFILPNDHVDVVLTQHVKNVEHPNQADIIQSQVVLSNIRVLAIDQAPSEKDGQNALIGKTVTLELKPEQIATLSEARQSGTLSLALRSLADAKGVESAIVETKSKRADTVNIIRFGISTPATK